MVEIYCVRSLKENLTPKYPDLAEYTLPSYSSLAVPGSIFSDIHVNGHMGDISGIEMRTPSIRLALVSTLPMLDIGGQRTPPATASQH